MQSIASPHGHGKIPSARGIGIATVTVAIAYTTADAAVLYTVPDGHYLRLARAYWLVTTAFAGGSSSAIGLSASKTGHTTKGDLLGGATGDVEATLVAGFQGGTVGTDMDGNKVVVLAPGDTVKFDRITSVFTSGAGYAVLEFVEVGDTAT